MKSFVSLFLMIAVINSLIAPDIPCLAQEQDFNTSGYLLNKESRKLNLWHSITQGDASLFKGDLVEAERNYKEAYDRIEDILANEKGPRIGILNETIFDPIDRLGNLYLLTNNLRKAEHYFKLSQKLRDVSLPARSLFRVPPLIGLGEVYLSQNDLQKAKVHLHMAEDIFYSSTTSFYNHAHIGSALMSTQFELALKLKEYKKAEKYLDRLSTGGFGPGSDAKVISKYPRIFELRARFFMDTGEYEKAHYYLDKASLFANVLSHVLINFKVLKTDALLLWSEDRIEDAALKFEELTLAYKKYIVTNFAAMSEYERERFFANLKKDFDLFNTFIIQNKDHKNVGQFYITAYNNQLFSKALLLNQLDKMKDQILQGGDEQLISKLKEWESAKAHLSTLYYQKKRNTTEISETESRINDLERALNENTGVLKSLTNQITWVDVQKKLKPNEVAVEIIRTQDFILRSELENVSNYSFVDDYKYLVLTIDSESESPAGFVVENAKELDNKYLNYYRNAIKFQLEDHYSYRQYWDPIKKQIEGHDRVYLSSDGVYNQINLNTIQNPNTGAYLLDELSIVLVTNTKDLLESKSTSNFHRADLFGHPQYLSDSSKVVPDTSSFVQSNLRSMDSEVFENFRAQTFVELPGTENEVKSIESLLVSKDWDVIANYGVMATENTLKRSSNPYLLHIATHGFFLPQNNSEGVNSMIRSGIILAGVDKESLNPNDDGLLTAYEATNLQLDSTYLVVLSACETGLGEIKNGEGVYGLQRGLKVAGAKYILMSLWKVDDKATQQLMELFYKSWLNGDDIHKAFKQAQLGLRASYPHPFYWGAFVLLGN